MASAWVSRSSFDSAVPEPVQLDRRVIHRALLPDDVSRFGPGKQRRFEIDGSSYCNRHITERSLDMRGRGIQSGDESMAQSNQNRLVRTLVASGGGDQREHGGSRCVDSKDTFRPVVHRRTRAAVGATAWPSAFSVRPLRDSAMGLNEQNWFRSVRRPLLCRECTTAVPTRPVMTWQ